MDVRNVIWLGTSNIGQDLVFEHHDTRVGSALASDEKEMTREEYRDLMALLRPRVTAHLGVSFDIFPRVLVVDMTRVNSDVPYVSGYCRPSVRSFHTRGEARYCCGSCRVAGQRSSWI